jgi:hypothetical protein
MTHSNALLATRLMYEVEPCAQQGELGMLGLLAII